MDNVREGRICAVLGIEGAHALEGEVSRVAELASLGVRFMSLTHLTHNELGGGAFLFRRDKALTPLGHQVLDAMASERMSVDVAHASPATLQGILEHPRAQPFCSHAGAAALSSPWRNLSDGVLRRIADRGGVVGIIFSPVYLGGRSLDAVVRHVRHALDVMGEDAVALGSDFDGMAGLPRQMRDVTDVPKLLEALRAEGLTEGQVEKVAGLNLRRFFERTLP
jgi:membrane dipeptidase